ncbi:MAG: SDR family NAD(P)-dependent oxidoreductase [Gemmiger sp.]|nr:SDR family NAD(P)-dependent oxidoreductase [Gemmiger sp.]
MPTTEITANHFFEPAGSRALITGGTSGLGYAIAEAFLQSGVDVAVCGTRPEKAAPLAALAQTLGRRFLALRCNITDTAAVDAMMDEVQAGFGGLDFVVNSAGMNALKPAEDYDAETFDKVMDLNVKGTHLVSKGAAKRFFIPQNSGRIVNISSAKGFIGTGRDYAAYCASKGAINMYTKQLACEWAKFGINTNAIAPTFVRTPINAAQLDNPEFYAKLVARIPAGRIGMGADIAAAALYLCSKGASFVNGVVLPVDGGLTAMQ